MITKITKLLAVVFMGTILTGTALGQECAKNFKLELQKVIINGKVFFEAGKIKDKTIEVDSAKAAKIQYVFKNTGAAATTVAGRVFVHFDYNKKILLGGDFWPKTKTSKWVKDFVFTQTNTLNFKKAKNKTINMYLGVYFPNAKGVRLKFKGAGSGNRFAVGKIVVK